MSLRFRPSARTLSPDPIVTAATASQVRTRLASLGYMLPLEQIVSKPLSEIVRATQASSRSGVFVLRALRDELSRVR